MGAFDERDPLSLHMLGMHGSVYANKAIQNADLIIAIGARFDDRVTGKVSEFGREAKRAAAENRGGIIHFDISAKQIDKIIPSTVSVIGDCKYNLTQLLPAIESRPRTAWHRQVQAWKARYPFRYRRESKEAFFLNIYICEYHLLSSLLTDKCSRVFLLAGENSANQPLKPQRVIEELYLQTRNQSENVVGDILIYSSFYIILY